METPGTHSGRIIELDALRGVAVIGIVWMNVLVFAMPGQAYYNPVAWGPGIGEASAGDRLVWAASFVFIEDKFRTIFAMLFGAGCLILIERSQSRKWQAHFARMAVLFGIGLVHAVVLASNDVLRAYALAGLALPLLAHLSARELYAIAIGLVVLHCGAGLVMFGGAILDHLGGRTTSDAALFAERNFGRDEAAIRYALSVGTEGLPERIFRRLDSIPEQITAISGSVPLNVAAMALGMGLWKQRMLAGEWRTYLLQRLAAVCALVSIPGLLALVWWTAQSDFSGAVAGASALLISAPFDTLLGLAYAALAMAFFTPAGAITARLAAVGRLSLTNYLMTSVMLGAIFAGWGLGLFGSVSRSEALLLGIVPVAAMLVWSPVWNRRFGQGPFERLWRAGASLLA